MWTSLPKEAQTERRLRELADGFAQAPRGDAAASILHGRLLRLGQEPAASVIVDRWARARSKPHLPGSDAFLAQLRGTPHGQRYVDTIAIDPHAGPIGAEVAALCPPRTLAFWREIESRRAMVLHLRPRARLLAATVFWPQGQTALENSLLSTLNDVVDAIEIPDDELSAAARVFAATSTAPAPWEWLAAVTGSKRPSSGELDELVQSLCGDPPPAALRAPLLALSTALGALPTLTADEASRWATAMALAPDGDGSGFPIKLTTALVQGVARGPDGPARLLALTRAVGGLPKDHLALRLFARRALPNAFAGTSASLPDGADTLPEPLRTAFTSAFTAKAP
jgi:hypothetical protein